MAKARKCDRCGTYHDGLIYHLTLDNNKLFVDYDTTQDYDLCNECIDEFVDFMNGVRPATLREKLLARFKRKD